VSEVVTANASAERFVAAAGKRTTVEQRPTPGYRSGPAAGEVDRGPPNIDTDDPPPFKTDRASMNRLAQCSPLSSGAHMSH